MYVALLEDEPDLAAEVRTLLEHRGHSVTTFVSGSHIIRALAVDAFDLLILDWNVPGPSGLEVLHHVRRQLHSTVPVIFLTSNLSEGHVVEALNAGSDDYCGKPLRASEFMARLHALERRIHAGGTLFGEEHDLPEGYRLNPAERTVTVDGEVVRLSEKEFELMQLMFQNLGRPLSRTRIMAHVWGRDEDALSRTLDVHVSWLRRKLKLGADGGVLRLQVVRGYGYRLVQGDQE